MANLPDPFRSDQPFGTIDPRGQWILDEESADLLNGLREEMVRLGQVDAALPLTVASDAAGTRIAIEQRQTIFAKLSGSTSPYAWAEAKKDAAGVASLLTGGLSGTDAYEANGQSGLSGKYVTMDRSRAGDWRFQLPRAGVSNPNACAAYCIKVVGPDLVGLTATLVGTKSGSPWTRNVTINSSGTACYDVADESPIPTITGARVTSPCGTSTTSSFSRVGTTCTATFYYCRRVVRASYTSAANPDVNPGMSGTITDDGSTVTSVSCYLSTTNPGPTFFDPLPVTATAVQQGCSGVWPSACDTGTVPCGGSIDLDVTQQEFSSEYFRASQCDLGCDHGKGPCNRNLIPRHIQIKFETLSPYSLFADDEGTWIDLYGTATTTSACSAVVINFDSGCRGAQGNKIYGRADGGECYLNTDPAVFGLDYQKELPFSGTRISLIYNSLARDQVSYGRYAGPGCTGTTGNAVFYNGANAGAVLNCGCAVLEDDRSQIAWPCFTYGDGKANFCAGRVGGGGVVGFGESVSFRYTIRELGCGGTYDESSSSDDDDMVVLDPGPGMALGFEEGDVLIDEDGNAFAAE